MYAPPEKFCSRTASGSFLNQLKYQKGQLTAVHIWSSSILPLGKAGSSEQCSLSLTRSLNLFISLVPMHYPVFLQGRILGMRLLFITQMHWEHLSNKEFEWSGQSNLHLCNRWHTDGRHNLMPSLLCKHFGARHFPNKELCSDKWLVIQSGTGWWEGTNQLLCSCVTCRLQDHEESQVPGFTAWTDCTAETKAVHHRNGQVAASFPGSLVAGRAWEWGYKLGVALRMWHVMFSLCIFCSQDNEKKAVSKSGKLVPPKELPGRSVIDKFSRLWTI